MDDDAALGVLRDAAVEFADTAARDLDRAVPTYPGWSVADLVAHTGRIHRWGTRIVEARATARPAQPDLARRPDDLIGWFRTGVTRVLDVLAAAPAAAPVWSFGADRTVAFWRRRMALETTIHRWDVQRAFGGAAPIADAVAVAGVTEALAVYLVPRLQGADVGGAGELVGLRPTTGGGGAPRWVVRLRTDGLDLLDGARDESDPADVWIEAPPTDLWLFLMGRAPRTALAWDGPEGAVQRLERAVALLPRPSA